MDGGGVRPTGMTLWLAGASAAAPPARGRGLHHPFPWGRLRQPTPRGCQLWVAQRTTRRSTTPAVPPRHAPPGGASYMYILVFGGVVPSTTDQQTTRTPGQPRRTARFLLSPHRGRPTPPLRTLTSERVGIGRPPDSPPRGPSALGPVKPRTTGVVPHWLVPPLATPFRSGPTRWARAANGREDSAYTNKMLRNILRRASRNRLKPWT